MSFADSLGQNYSPKRTDPLTPKQQNIKREASFFAYDLQRNCRSASHHSHTLEGYYVHGDGYATEKHIGSRTEEKVSYLYRTPATLKRFGEQSTYTEEEKQFFVHAIKDELIKLGFKQFIVKTEDIMGIPICFAIPDVCLMSMLLLSIGMISYDTRKSAYDTSFPAS